ncbi:MAG: TrkA family potassium uptake protein [Clostridia bacterium]|nr:TrkA family potassium uptake protein [Candidatus Pelethousia sp.]NCB30878.1 TrkA family potassium uptake protein [Clostridia bacterium]
MKKNFLVLGLGRFGGTLSTTLCQLGHEVVAVDVNAARVEMVKDLVTHAIQANITDERAVAQLGVRNFDCVAVCTGDDIRTSVLAVVMCKEYGAKYLICKASDPLHEKLLYKTGADKVFQPEREGAARLAHSLVSPSVLDFIELSDTYSISDVRLPKSWAGKSLAEMNVRVKYGFSVIALRRNGQIIITIDPFAPLLQDDELVIIGTNKDLSRIDTIK